VALLAALALRELGRSDEAAALLAGWPATQPERELVKAWALKVYAGDPAAARALLAAGLAGQTVSPWSGALRDRSLPIVIALVAGAGP
jgi:hypothetical protein